MVDSNPNMTISAFDEIVLTDNLPSGKFGKGTIGVVADVLKNGEGYVIEFFAANGETLGVEILKVQFVAPAFEFPFPVKVVKAA